MPLVLHRLFTGLSIFSFGNPGGVPTLRRHLPAVNYRSLTCHWSALPRVRRAPHPVLWVEAHLRRRFSREQRATMEGEHALRFSAGQARLRQKFVKNQPSSAR